MTEGLKGLGGTERSRWQKLASVYLWIALFLAIPVGRLRDLAGTEVLLCGYVVFVSVFAVAVWQVGASRTKAARERPTFLPGVLLLAGPLALLLVASVTGEPTASRPGDYVLTARCDEDGPHGNMER